MTVKQTDKSLRASGKNCCSKVQKERTKRQTDRKKQREKMATHTNVMTKVQNEPQIYRHVSKRIYR